MRAYLDCGELGELEIDVEYDYRPGTPGVQYLRNGDPGYPDEPEQIEITAIKIIKYNVYLDMKDLDEEIIAKLEDRVSEWEATK